MLGIAYHLQEIAELCGARDLFQGLNQQVSIRQIAFDTRRIHNSEETIFIALTTANRDGHSFLEDAMAAGVRNFIVDRPLPYKGINYILVDDSLSALQLWALNHRVRFSCPVIAITGSNGKTTVKEWLSTVLEWEYRICKSPMSYNSQLGVPLSILRMHPDTDIAIIEAGISTVDEMEILAGIIQPDLGIFTHLGDAHQEGFDSLRQKWDEKIQLFSTCKNVFIHDFQKEVLQWFEASHLPISLVGKSKVSSIRIVSMALSDLGWSITLTEGEQSYDFQLKLFDRASLSNALLVILCSRHLGLSFETIRKRIGLVSSVSMRTEMITDESGITIINDTYNSDIDSVRNAFQSLIDLRGQKKAYIVLSDLEQQGQHTEQVHRQILKEAVPLVGEDQLFTIGPIFKRLRKLNSALDKEAFIQMIAHKDWGEAIILLKGSRVFALEGLIPHLSSQVNASQVQISLGKLAQNFRYLKSLVPEGIKTMCMVKASSYGSGTWEIAKVLEAEGANYLAVAYTSEGITLRKAGIHLPIMVMNPDRRSIAALLSYNLEPEIYNEAFLKSYIQQARLYGNQEISIHLKLETGMGRLGFEADEIPSLAKILQSSPDIRLISVLSHLAAADDPSSDKFTLEQLQTFEQMYAQLAALSGISSFRHILNTAGIMRFPDYAYEMVRMGIGLYGLDPTYGPENKHLQEIGTLSSVISQIKSYPKGISVGYGRSQFTTRSSRIATIPIGYADGIPRNVGNGKAQFMVRGRQAPTFGRICMDMLMLDVSDIIDVVEGDKVLIYGQLDGMKKSIYELADAAETIPYEILVRISERVKKIYVRE